MRLQLIGHLALAVPLLLVPAAAAQSAPGCDDARESCPPRMEPAQVALSPVSFNSPALKRFRSARLPPWRVPVGPRGPGLRLAELHEMALRGERPALPHFRRDASGRIVEQPFSFVTTTARGPLVLPPLHVAEPELWGAVFESLQIGDDCPCLLAPTDGPGEVPAGDGDGAPMTMTRVGNQVVLSWSPSCSSNATDYAVHGGLIGDWYNYVRFACSTGGLTTVTLTPGPGPTYYLVVPLNGLAEGGYGRDGNGQPRPVSAMACRQDVVAADCR